MELLIPSWADLAGWASVFVVTLAFIGFGRLVSAGRAAPEAALVAGWGGACLVLTLWGLASSLLVPAVIVVVLGVLGHLSPDRVLPAAAWRGMGRILAVALPLLAVMASARPSLPDTFLNLLPNAAYLYDHAGFPADDRAPSYSLLPGAPYNMQLAAFLVSLIAQGFATNAMIAFNIVLQLGFALFLARLVDGGQEADMAGVPSWRATALGLLLTTAFNPGFVPRYHLSGYSEASVTVTLAFAAWFAARALQRLAEQRPAGADLSLFALTLAALVNIKQDSVALAASLVLSAILLVALERRRGWRRSTALVVAAAMPGAVLYLAWRWYVLRHFATGELKLLPLAQWQFAKIPLIFASMLDVVAEKPFFFGATALAFAGLIWHWWRRGIDRTTRVAALFAGVTLLYNAALLVPYIALFGRDSGPPAHSYFRYNTHLGLLLVLTLLLIVREWAASRDLRLRREARRIVPPALFAAVVILPPVFFSFLRFDLEEPQQRVWELAALGREALDEDPRLALLLPGDDGSLDTMLRGLLRFTPPQHVDAEFRTLDRLGPTTLDGLAKDGFRLGLISCTPGGLAGLPAGQAALLDHDASGWRAARRFSYHSPRLPVRRSHVIAEAPLCL